jgi:hypothetical protein
MNNLEKDDDTELSTPKHDALVLELLNQETAKKLLSFLELEVKDPIKIYSEYPIGENFIVGYWDILYIYYTLSFGIEVKTSIESFGKVMRQLNKYKYSAPYNCTCRLRDVVLYTPDRRFKEAFESQDIRVISPDDLKKE